MTAITPEETLTYEGLAIVDNQIIADRLAEGFETAGITHGGEDGYHSRYSGDNTICQALQAELPDAEFVPAPQADVELGSELENQVSHTPSLGMVT